MADLFDSKWWYGYSDFVLRVLDLNDLSDVIKLLYMVTMLNAAMCLKSIIKMNCSPTLRVCNLNTQTIGLTF